MSLLRNTSWSAAASIISTAGRVALVVILARRLGPSLFGLFVFVQWMIEVTSLVCSAGLPGAATRFFPQTAASDAVQMPGFSVWFLRWSVVAIAVTGGVATLCAFWFSGFSDARALTAIGFWAASYTGWALLSARAQGLFRFRRYAVSSAVFVVVALLGLGLQGFGRDVVGAMIAFGAANFAAAACCAVNMPDARLGIGSERLSRRDAQVVWPYATNAWVTSIAASFVWARGEIAVVKGHLDESAVGLYSVGITLAGVVNQGLALLTGGLWAQIARGWDSGERTSVLRLSNIATTTLMLAAGLSSGFVICFAPYLVTLFFGEAYVQSTTLVAILALGPLGLASGAAHLVVQAATNGRFGRNLTIAGGVMLFGVAYILVPLAGAAGAAWARSATQIAIAASALVSFERVTGQDVQARRNIRSFLILITLNLALFSVVAFRPDVQLVGRLALFAVYCGSLAVIGAPFRDPGFLLSLRTLMQGRDG